MPFYFCLCFRCSGSLTHFFRRLGFGCEIIGIDILDNAELFENRRHDAPLLGNQRAQQMQGIELGVMALLGKSRLDIRPGAVVLQAEEAWMGRLLGDLSAKRGAALAGLLGRELKLRALDARAGRDLARAG